MQKKKGEKKKSQVSFGNLARKTRSNSQEYGGLRASECRNYPSNPCLDSGASKTLFKQKSEAVPGTYKHGSDTTVQLAAGEKQATCIGEGTLKYGSITLEDAVHVDQLNSTLVSVPHICDLKKIVVFTKNEAVILDISKFSVDESIVDCVVPRDTKTGLYIFKQELNAHANASLDITLMHRRLIHSNEKVVRKSIDMAKDNSETTSGKFRGRLDTCHPCELGKAHHQPFKSTFEIASRPGEVVHSDLDGPLPNGISGAKYLCTFVDQATRHITIATFASKSDTKEAHQKYKTSSLVRKYFPNGVERLHTDGGREYKFADKVDVEHTSTAKSTPQHNPFAERANRTIFDPVRTVLEEACLSAKYWELAAHHVVHVKNRLYNKSIKKSPYELLTNQKPPLHHIRVFGCAAFVYNEEPKSKVHARAKPAIYLGSDDYGVHTCEIIPERKIVQCKHVTFDESSFPALEFDSSSSSGSDGEDSAYEDDESNGSCIDNEIVRVRTKLGGEIVQEREQATGKEKIPRPQRTHKQPERYTPSAKVAKYFVNNVITVPVTTSDTP